MRKKKPKKRKLKPIKITPTVYVFEGEKKFINIKIGYRPRSKKALKTESQVVINERRLIAAKKYLKSKEVEYVSIFYTYINLEDDKTGTRYEALFEIGDLTKNKVEKLLESRMKSGLRESTKVHVYLEVYLYAAITPALSRARRVKIKKIKRIKKR